MKRAFVLCDHIWPTSKGVSCASSAASLRVQKLGEIAKRMEAMPEAERAAFRLSTDLAAAAKAEAAPPAAAAAAARPRPCLLYTSPSPRD